MTRPPLLTLLIFILSGPLTSATFHSDCFHRFTLNAQRICKSYPNMKRSTPGIDFQGGYYNGEEQGIDWRGYWNRARGIDWTRYEYGNNPGGQGGMYPQPQGQRRMDDEYPVEWLFNPLDYGVDNQLPLERWRRQNEKRNEEIIQLAKKCCLMGCTFPDDYFELDRRINLCHLR